MFMLACRQSPNTSQSNTEITEVEETTKVATAEQVIDSSQMELNVVSTPKVDAKPKQAIRKRTSVIVPKSEIIAQPTVQEKLAVLKLLNPQLTDKLASKPQQFSVNNSKLSSINGKQGTIIVFPPNAFTTKSGKPITKPVDITLVECYSLAEMFGHNLSTTSNGDIIETAGMINIQASSGGEQVVLKKGAKYEVRFPQNQSDKENFQLFYGRKTAAGELDWELETKSNLETTTQKIPNQQEGLVVSNLQRSGCSYQISGYTTMINSKDVKWKLKEDKRDIFTYFMQEFSVSDELRAEFCKDSYDYRINIKINKQGKITTINPVSRKVRNEMDLPIDSFLLNLPALSLNAIAYAETDMYANYFLGISNGVVFNTEKYKKEFLEEKVVGDKMQNVDTEEMEKYVFAASELGWINCDQFYKNSSPKIDFVLETENAENTSAFLKFKSINALMMGYLQNGKLVFKNIPTGQAVSIISIQSYEKIPSMAVSQATTSNKPLLVTNYRPFTVSQLNEQLKSL